jgi:hypothetical protein
MYLGYWRDMMANGRVCCIRPFLTALTLTVWLRCRACLMATCSPSLQSRSLYMEPQCEFPCPTGGFIVSLFPYHICLCSKKFLIEKLSGEKVVSRQKGFTVETCVGVQTSTGEIQPFMTRKVIQVIQRTFQVS